MLTKEPCFRFSVPWLPFGYAFEREMSCWDLAWEIGLFGVRFIQKGHVVLSEFTLGLFPMARRRCVLSPLCQEP